VEKAPDMLKSFVERVERVQEEIDGLNGDKALLYLEAKASGINRLSLQLAVLRRRRTKEALPFRAKPVHEPRIYFMAFPDIGRLKIGISGNLQQRALTLSRSSSAAAVVLGSFPGNKQDESLAHLAFFRFQVAREWFEYSTECAAAAGDYLRTRGVAFA
jgi:hypothetical protein